MFRKGMGVCILGFVQCVAAIFWQSEQWVRQSISPPGEIALGVGKGEGKLCDCAGKGAV